MTSRILVTGANGFVGRILTPLLQHEGYQVVALGRHHSGSEPCPTEYIVCDLCDAAAMDKVIERIQPSHVIHLAAVSHVPTSYAEPEKTWLTNVTASANLLEAVRTHAPNAFVLFASSAEVYGASFKRGVPLDEQAPCEPLNPYSTSKLAAERLFDENFRSGISGVIARPFNHIGPQQSHEFVTASFARQIALIELGRQPPVLSVGNLEASRDFLDVRDVCNAYIRLLAMPPGGDYPRLFNISSGASRQIRSVLMTLLSMSTREIEIVIDPARFRPSDIPVASGNSERLHRLTGWKPRIPLEQTLSELLTYWRKRISMHDATP